jgi:hypothetical protein
VKQGRREGRSVGALSLPFSFCADMTVVDLRRLVPRVDATLPDVSVLK